MLSAAVIAWDHSTAMASPRVYRAGESIEDHCRACKVDRLHTIIVVDGSGSPLRVMCDYCESQHNFRGGPQVAAAMKPIGGISAVSEPERIAPTVMPPRDENDLEALLRRVIREEAGITPVTPAQKWRGGMLVLRPAAPGMQEKSWPIETFFHKVVMLRNRLRTLEQQVNASELPDDVKVKLQAYVSGCYGTLTSFNILFADEADHFKGGGD
jgi:hypothetical protein